ncbi:hypothetical protein FRC10_002347 [Ceratobasidium sp. 414]|nr:hypothetical protein FRC10_002347 [Ceratobasidium sp. 414]
MSSQSGHKFLQQAGSNVVLAARRTEILEKVMAACETAHKDSATSTPSRTYSRTFQPNYVRLIYLVHQPSLGRYEKPNFNSAGFVLGVERVGEISDTDVEAMFSTNVLGLISMTQALIAVRRSKNFGLAMVDSFVDFKKRQTGHFINIGSVAGREPYVGGSIYGMVETGFPVTRFRGDKSAADKVCTRLQPFVVEAIAEEIVWAAAQPPHVNLASATLSYRKPP